MKVVFSRILRPIMFSSRSSFTILITILSAFAIQFTPLLDNEQLLTIVNQSPTSKNNKFGSAGLAKRDAAQTSIGAQVFNLILCSGVFFIEMSSNPNFVLQSGPSGTPATIGFRDPIALYPWQLFILDGPFIRLAFEIFK